MNNKQKQLTLSNLFDISEVEILYVDGRTAVVFDRINNLEHLIENHPNISPKDIVIIGCDDYMQGDKSSESEYLKVFVKNQELFPCDVVIGRFFITDLQGEEHVINVVENLSVGRIQNLIQLNNS